MQASPAQVALPIPSIPSRRRSLTAETISPSVTPKHPHTTLPAVFFVIYY